MRHTTKETEKFQTHHLTMVDAQKMSLRHPAMCSPLSILPCSPTSLKVLKVQLSAFLPMISGLYLFVDAQNISTEVRLFQCPLVDFQLPLPHGFPLYLLHRCARHLHLVAYFLLAKLCAVRSKATAETWSSDPSFHNGGCSNDVLTPFFHVHCRPRGSWNCNKVLFLPMISGLYLFVDAQNISTKVRLLQCPLVGFHLPLPHGFRLYLLQRCARHLPLVA